MLHQLATKGSSSKLIVNNDDDDPYEPTTIQDLPLFKGLVTTTLTTLHTRLMNECDRALSMILLVDSPPPQEQLLSIVSDLYKMTEMVNFKDEELSKKKEIKLQLATIEQSILHQELNIITVKEHVSIMKQLMNICICQYYKQVEKAMIIPSKGYRIEGINKYGNNNNSIAAMDTSTIVDYSNTIIDHMDNEANWYRKYFMDGLNTTHFFGYNKDEDPILISIKVEENNTTSTNRQYRIIHRTKKEKDVRKVILDSFLLNAPGSNHIGDNIIPDTTWKSIIETTLSIPYHHLLKMNGDYMISTGINDELLRLDENGVNIYIYI
jgi:hypothetical protein